MLLGSGGPPQFPEGGGAKPDAGGAKNGTGGGGVFKFGIGPKTGKAGGAEAMAAAMQQAEGQ